MVFDDVLRSQTSRLAAAGFSLAGDTGTGPMGSRVVRFAAERLTIELISDRGTLTVNAGPRNQPTFVLGVWAIILGLSAPPAGSTDEEIEFLLDHIRDIDKAVESEPSILEKLRQANWRYVKEHLGLSPDMMRPGERSAQ